MCESKIGWPAQPRRALDALIAHPGIQIGKVAARKSKEGEAGPAAEQGFVLLVVLWVLTSAVLLVACFNGTVRSGSASAISEIGQTKAEALLDAGLEIAAAHLIDHYKKLRWLGDGTPHSISFAGAELTITINDANGLVDLNKSDEKLLRALFQKFTNSPTKAAQYTDVILRARDVASGENDPDENNTAAGGPANTSHPELAFIDVAQLGRLPGIPRDVFKQVAPFLTVYSDDGTIYPAVAAVQVLEAIPIINRTGVEKVRHADKSTLVGLMGEAPAFLNYESGRAHLVTVHAHRPNDNHGMSRKFVIATGIDSDAPYRLLAKWPPITMAAEKSK